MYTVDWNKNNQHKNQAKHYDTARKVEQQLASGTNHHPNSGGFYF